MAMKVGNADDGAQETANDIPKNPLARYLTLVIVAAYSVAQTQQHWLNTSTDDGAQK
jgi:hypothetical protein